MIKREGVGHVFTLSGLHVAPIYDGCLNEEVKIIDTRHEQAARRPHTPPPATTQGR
jgi:acetolactate synthase-1/2/3 large subunit